MGPGFGEAFEDVDVDAGFLALVLVLGFEVSLGNKAVSESVGFVFSFMLGDAVEGDNG